MGAEASMGKRKRSVRFDIKRAAHKLASSDDSGVRADMEQMQEELKKRQRHNAEKQLRRALKKVKTFEQRKLARAIKQASDDATVRAKKEADASTVKALCLDTLAKEAFLLLSDK